MPDIPASKYIIVGPRPFTSSNPAQLVLYNQSKDPFSSTKAQIWLGDSCKEVALKTELKAHVLSDYRGQGLGMLSSDLPVPAGAHSYMVVLNSGIERPEVIIRDDGEVMTDYNQLVEKFKIAPDTQWRTSGWTGQKVLLFHIIQEKASYPGDPRAGQDQNTANWFYYNVETDTYIHDLPPYGAF